MPKLKTKLLITYTTKICYQQGFPVQNYIRLSSIGVEKWDNEVDRRQELERRGVYDKSEDLATMYYLRWENEEGCNSNFDQCQTNLN